MSSSTRDALHEPERLRAVRGTDLLDSAPEESFDRLTRLAARTLRAPLALVNLLTESRQFSKSCFAPAGWPAERETPVEASFCRYAIESREPLSIEDTVEDPRVASSPLVTRQGLRAYLGVPLITSDGHPLGTLCVADFQPRRWSEQEIATLCDLAAGVVSEIELRAQVRRTETAEELAGRLRRSEERLSFLSRVSLVLAEEVVDFDQVLQRLAQLAVPALGDWCLVYLRRDDGGIEVVANAHAGGEREALRELGRYPPDPTGPHPAARVIRSGEPMLLREVPQGMLERLSYSEHHLALLRSLDIRSSIFVPLAARGHTLGAMVLAASGPSRRYGTPDLEIAVEFAQRVAVPVDNARLLHDAQEASRAKSEFLAVMSHELRTPLNALVGYVELLELEVVASASARAREYAERIGRAARHLTRLIADVLTYTDLQAGRETVVREPVDLTALLAEVHERVAAQAREKGLALSLELPPDPQQLLTDAPKLRQVLLGLLDNAIKFTETGGEIGLRARALPGAVELEVWDTGIGVEPEDRERIFEPFWQVVQSKVRTAGGTGLGLSMARKLVELLGGTLTHVPRPGPGSTFLVRLPHRDPPHATSYR